MSKTMSKHAGELLVLGFHPLRTSARPLPEKSEKRLRDAHVNFPSVKPPWRVTAGFATYVTDENGLIWVGPAEIDISHMGFKDLTQEYQKARSILHEGDPDLN